MRAGLFVPRKTKRPAHTKGGTPHKIMLQLADHEGFY